METPATRPSSASFSVTSIIAIAAAIGSFMTGAFSGLILAGIAIVFGIFGVLKAMSPAVRGGIASTLAIIAGAVGVFAALVKAILWVVGSGA